jgi:D-lactate dehydrogenase (cytochrome)
VSQLIKSHNAGKFIFAKTKQDELDLWAGRKESLFTMVATKPENTILWSTDVAVPLSRLAEIIG